MGTEMGEGLLGSLNVKAFNVCTSSSTKFSMRVFLSIHGVYLSHWRGIWNVSTALLSMQDGCTSISCALLLYVLI